MPNLILTNLNIQSFAANIYSNSWNFTLANIWIYFYFIT